MVGVDTAKDAIIAGCGSASRGPGYIHFPIGGAFDETYFAQLTAETVQTRYKEGRPYRVWVLAPGKANEALDTAVDALAARHATRVRLDLPPRPANPRRIRGPIRRKARHRLLRTLRRTCRRRNISRAGAVSSFAAGIWWASEAWPARRPAAGKPPCVISWRSTPEARQGRDGRHSRPRLPRRLR